MDKNEAIRILHVAMDEVYEPAVRERLARLLNAISAEGLGPKGKSDGKDSIETRITNLGQHVGKLYGKIANLELSLGESLEQLAAKATRLESDLAQIRGRVDRVSETCSQVFQAQDERLDKTEEDVRYLKGRLERIFRAVTKRFEEIEGRLNQAEVDHAGRNFMESLDGWSKSEDLKELAERVADLETEDSEWAESVEKAIADLRGEVGNLHKAAVAASLRVGDLEAFRAEAESLEVKLRSNLAPRRLEMERRQGLREALEIVESVGGEGEELEKIHTELLDRLKRAIGESVNDRARASGRTTWTDGEAQAARRIKEEATPGEIVMAWRRGASEAINEIGRAVTGTSDLSSDSRGWFTNILSEVRGRLL